MREQGNTRQSLKGTRTPAGRPSVVDEGELTDWFRVTSGVKQGCVMSGFPFLLVADWAMRRATEGRRTGIRWNFTDVLEDLDFADDIAFLVPMYEHIQGKTDRLIAEAGRIGLRLNASKCKGMRINARRMEDQSSE